MAVDVHAQPEAGAGAAIRPPGPSAGLRLVVGDLEQLLGVPRDRRRRRGRWVRLQALGAAVDIHV